MLPGVPSRPEAPVLPFDPGVPLGPTSENTFHIILWYVVLGLFVLC